MRTASMVAAVLMLAVPAQSAELSGLDLSNTAPATHAMSGPLSPAAQQRQPAPTLTRPQPFMRKDAPTSAFAYSCQTKASDCTVYDQNGKIIGALTSGIANPEGITVDSKGNLFIANGGASNVLEYARGGITLIKTLADPNQSPREVAVAPSGTVAVSGNGISGSGPATSVSVYVGGATTPSYFLNDSSAVAGTGITFDRSGNCYWSIITSTGGTQIDEFTGCSGSAQNLGISPSPGSVVIGTGAAGSLAYMSNNRIYNCSNFVCVPYPWYWPCVCYFWWPYYYSPYDQYPYWLCFWRFYYYPGYHLMLLGDEEAGGFDEVSVTSGKLVHKFAPAGGPSDPAVSFAFAAPSKL